MNIIDRTIGYFSPKKAIERQFYRRVLEKRKYEGASKSKRTQGWVTNPTSSNAELYNQISTLRNRARDLVRNNPYSSRAVTTIANGVVGLGVIPSITADNENLQNFVQAKWREFAESHEASFDMPLNFYGIQNLVMRSTVESGEILVRKRTKRPTREHPFNFNLQCLEADHLVTQTYKFEGVRNNNVVLMGIEVDQKGIPQAYHVYQNHPGGYGLDSINIQDVFKILRIDYDDICHVYRIDRPGQLRGASWLAPVIIRLRELDEYEDAQLVQSKVGASFAAFIQDIEMPADLGAKDDHDFDLEKLSPGIIEWLPPGKSITFANPSMTQGESHKTYVNTNLHAIATGLGMTYETLTGDLSQVNYSSGRMGHLDFQRNLDCWRTNLLVPQFCKRVFGWFLESLMMTDGVEPEGLRVSWTPPKREMIDPTKETAAKIEAIKSGLESYSDTVRQMGKDPKEHLAEIANDIKLFEAAGLQLAIDPRQNNNEASQGEI